MLGVHPAVCVVPSETHLFSDGVRHLQERVQHGLASAPATGTVYMERAAFLEATRAFCDALFSGLADVLSPGATHVVERTPMHVLHLPLVSAVYPDANVLHIVRDGRDVARSLVSKSWGPDDVAEAAAEWVTGITAARAAHLDPAQYREVRYESLLADPAGAMGALFAFVGLDAPDDVLAAVGREAAVVRNEDPLAPVPGAGKWKATWSASDLSRFEAVAGTLMDELGYRRAPALERATGKGPVTARIRRRARRSWTATAGALSAARSRSAPGGDTHSLDDAQHVVSRFFDLVSRGRGAEAVALMATDADINVVTDEGSWRGSGPAALARLAQAFEAEEFEAEGYGTDGRHGDEQVAYGAQFVVFFVREHPGGPTVHRSVVLKVEGRAITALHYRRFLQH